MQFTIIFWFISLTIGITAADNDACTEQPIESNMEKAHVILTGLVHLIRNENNSGRIRIERVIKGYKILHNHLKIQNGTVIGKFININRIGLTDICISNIEMGAVGIFLLNFDFVHGLFHLNSSIIKPYLKIKSQFSNGAPYNASNWVKCSPSAMNLCITGATCQINQIDKHVQCLCDFDCESKLHESSKICGLDGITYESMCYLKQSACLEQRILRVVSHRPCDPCNGIYCSYPLICKLNSDRKPHCTCEDQCNDDFKPVCANNGKTYLNQCYMTLDSCRLNMRLSVYRDGECSIESNPCDELNCMQEVNGYCHIDSNGTAVCKCQKYCENILKFVCGTDSVTYINECVMRRQACLKRKSVQVRYVGKCGSQQDLCLNVKCNYGAVCTIFNDEAICKCPQCNEEYKPVCGTNGITYINECKLRYDSCRHQITIQIDYKGPCDPCRLIKCDYYSTCVFDGSAAKCICLDTCDKTFMPTCGSDKRTYNSICDLHLQACKTQTAITVLNSGFCDESENTVWCINSEFGCCDDGITPADGPNKDGCSNECNCHVAGSYNQKCDAKTGQCNCRPGVTGKQCNQCAVGYWGIKRILNSNNIGCMPCTCNEYGSVRNDCNQEDGRCECKPGVSGIKCTECSHNHDLTSDGCIQKENLIDYQNPCLSIECNYPGSYCFIQNGQAKCKCDSIECQTETMPVCGEDGQTYESICALHKYACTKQIKLVMAYNGPCEETFDLSNMSSSDKGIKQIYNVTTKIALINALVGYKPYGTRKCTKDYDCGFNMECLLNICYCINGFIPENDHCIDPKLKKPKNIVGNNYKRYTFDACKSRPCLNGASCQSLINAKFVCNCPIGKIGRLCENTMDNIRMISFKNSSFIELSVNTEAPNKIIDVILEFKAVKPDGILFYTFKNQDFISIILRNLYLELRFHTGRGDKTVVLQQTIALGRYHKVYFQMKFKSILFKLDDFPALTDSTQYNDISFGESVFIGNILNSGKINSKFKRNIDITEGFEGCVQYLQINGEAVNIQYPSPTLLNGIGIDECPDKQCMNKTCLNKGRCRLFNNLKSQTAAQCVCSTKHTGKLCERPINPCLSNPCKQQNGTTCVPKNNGEFECVCFDNNLHKDVPFVARFNGSSYIERSLIEIPSNLSLNGSLYIGGLKSTIQKRFKVSTSFIGAIQKISIDGKNAKEPRAYAIELVNIQPYNGYPCNHTNCQNNGVCVPHANAFTCNCKYGFKGVFCEKKVERKQRHGIQKPPHRDAIYLDGHTELKYMNRISEKLHLQSMNKFELSFKTRMAHSLLLYTGDAQSNSYFTLAIVNGRLIFSFKMPKPKKLFILQSPTEINDNKWHTVIAERTRRKAVLTIDNQIKINSTLDDMITYSIEAFLTDGYIRVGGYRSLPYGLPQSYYQGFHGCLKNFKIDDRTVDLVKNNVLSTNYNLVLCKAMLMA